jgi:hypothetical protein
MSGWNWVSSAAHSWHSDWSAGRSKLATWSIEARDSAISPQLHEVAAASCERNLDPLVNTGRKLTPLDRLKVDPPGSGRWSRCVVVGHSAEVSVFQPVAVAFERDDFGVVQRMGATSRWR